MNHSRTAAGPDRRASAPPTRRRTARAAGFVRGATATATATALGCLLVAGCAASTTAAPGGEAPAGTATSAPPPSGTTPAAGDVAGLVDIGDGRSLYLECSGRGSPTVILISGTGNAADVWRVAGSATDPAEPPSATDAAVFPTTARSTRVCAYDRPGTLLDDGSPGRSTPVAQPTSTAGDVADIHALLTAAAVPAPYVLVGHSLGGLMATTYARTYPDDVVGLVLIDPASQFMETTMGPAAWDQYVQAALGRATTGGETIDVAASNVAINSLPPLPPMPVVVLSSDQAWFILPFGPDGALVDYSAALLDSQALLATSLDATHLTRTNSAHHIAIENAPLVNEQICAVIGPDTGC